MLNIPDWRGVLDAEKDGGFRAHVMDLTSRGLRALGFLGPVGVTLYVLLHVALGRRIVFDWPTVEHGIVIWDKLVIAAATAALVPLSRTGFARRHGRWIGLFVAVLASLASVDDDVLSGDASFSAAWVSLFLVIAAAALPFNPRQMLALAVSAILAFLVPVGLNRTAAAGEITAQTVFLISIALCITVVSVLVYHTRLVQYRTTERAVRLSGELEEKATRIQNLERMKSLFFTGITHDIRTPLSLVLGPVTDVLDHHEAALGDSVSAPLRIARRNAERLRLLVDDLLDLSQLEAGQLHVHRRPRDLGRQVDLWVTDLQPLAEREGVVLRLDRPEDPVVASVDSDRMEQVVQNLVGNAIAHTPRDGRVTVAVESVPDGPVRIRVSDTGPGIPEEILPHVFDRFYRASRDASQSGRGLGLAIARELTELHEGSLSATSRAGDGSTFTIELPACRDAPEEWIEEAERHEVPAHRLDLQAAAGRKSGEDAQPHVLVVDDNDDMRRYLRLHLEGQYRITEATRGDEALERILAGAPDLVLSDVMMPGLDGFELCRAIRSEAATATLPVVLLTARGDRPALLEGHRAGADAFLVKPFDGEALTAKLENLVWLRRMLAPPSTLGPTEILVQSADEEFVEKCRDLVERHIGDSNFGVEWLADEVGMASRTLQRHLRKATGLSAAGFIRMLRMGRAAQLLASGAKNVSETAYAVGFQDVDHFTRVFREVHGVLPSEYARAARADPPGG